MQGSHVSLLSSYQIKSDSEATPSPSTMLGQEEIYAQSSGPQTPSPKLCKYLMWCTENGKCAPIFGLSLLLISSPARSSWSLEDRWSLSRVVHSFSENLPSPWNTTKVEDTSSLLPGWLAFLSIFLSSDINLSWGSESRKSRCLE